MLDDLLLPVRCSSEVELVLGAKGDRWFDELVRDHVGRGGAAALAGLRRHHANVC